MSDTLALYVRPGCGYCEDVRGALRSLELQVEERDVFEDSEHMAALMAARGRATVPVLRIGEDRWLPESQDIIDYLHERAGKPRAATSQLQRVVPFAMWTLLLVGGFMSEPVRSYLWVSACALAAARSFHTAWRTGHWIHWAIGSAFATGAVSITLAVLGIASVPWWYLAFAIAVIVMGATVIRRRPSQTKG